MSFDAFEDARLHLPAFPEPVLRIAALYLRLDRTSLLTGDVEPVELRITGATLEAPAQLTPSGRGEELRAEAIADHRAENHVCEASKLPMIRDLLREAIAAKQAQKAAADLFFRKG